MAWGGSVACRQHCGLGRKGLSSQRSRMTMIPTMFPVVVATVAVSASWMRKQRGWDRSHQDHCEEEKTVTKIHPRTSEMRKQQITFSSV